MDSLRVQVVVFKQALVFVGCSPSKCVRFPKRKPTGGNVFSGSRPLFYLCVLFAIPLRVCLRIKKLRYASFSFCVHLPRGHLGTWFCFRHSHLGVPQKRIDSCVGLFPFGLLISFGVSQHRNTPMFMTWTHKQPVIKDVLLPQTNELISLV